jgi:PTS system fructose-specific IIA component/PTS system nitrogen regulatory IIA component
MKLSELLDADRIRIPLQSATKEDVLRELVSLLPGSFGSDDRESILESILDRESRMSTGIGQGVAIPHGKSPLVQGIEMTFGIAPKGIDYHALDGEPVDLFFLLVSPPDLTGPHIKALAQVARMLSSDSFRDELAEAVTADRVLELLREGEEMFEEEEA